MTSDIKAANVLLDTDGTAKLADYGYTVLVHVLLNRIELESRNIPREFWIAPENLKGFDTIDMRSDIWGVGCLVHELITGEPPFLEETEGKIDLLKLIHRRQGTSKLL